MRSLSFAPLLFLLVGGCRSSAPIVTGPARLSAVENPLIVGRGVVEPLRSTPVVVPKGGIKRWLVTEGEQVRAGQPLAEMTASGTIEVSPPSRPFATGGLSQRPAVTAAPREVPPPDLQPVRDRIARLETALRDAPRIAAQRVAAARSALSALENSRRSLVSERQPALQEAALEDLARAEAGEKEARIESERQAELEEKGYASKRAAESAKLVAATAVERVKDAKTALDRLGARIDREAAAIDEKIATARKAVREAEGGRSEEPRLRKAIAQERLALRTGTQAAMPQPETQPVPFEPSPPIVPLTPSLPATLLTATASGTIVSLRDRPRIEDRSGGRVVVRLLAPTKIGDLVEAEGVSGRVARLLIGERAVVVLNGPASVGRRVEVRKVSAPAPFSPR